MHSESSLTQILGRLPFSDMRAQNTPHASGVLLFDDDSSYVYLAYAASDDLLYVGVTGDLVARLGKHRRDESAWLTYVETLRWEAYSSRAKAEQVETHYIRTLHPRYNVRNRVPTAEVCREYNSVQWRRLGTHVRDRREELRRSQRSIASDAAMPIALLRSIETGQVTELPPDAVVGHLELALGWQSGSLRSILSGGASEPLDLAERQAHALAAYDQVLGGHR